MRFIRSLLVPVSLLQLWVGSSFADDKLEYDPPNVGTCDSRGVLGLKISNDSCLLVYAYARLDAGFASDSDFLTGSEAHLRVVGL